MGADILTHTSHLGADDIVSNLQARRTFGAVAQQGEHLLCKPRQPPRHLPAVCSFGGKHVIGAEIHPEFRAVSVSNIAHFFAHWSRLRLNRSRVFDPPQDSQFHVAPQSHRRQRCQPSSEPEPGISFPARGPAHMPEGIHADGQAHRVAPVDRDISRAAWEAQSSEVVLPARNTPGAMSRLQVGPSYRRYRRTGP
jgi:hypothetical protein